MLADHARMKVQMERKPRARPCTPRQQLGGNLKRDTVKVKLRQPAEPKVGFSHQGERGKEMPAELAISRPQPVLAQKIE